jgi:replication fork clamp-binding protein CrfC
VFTDLYADVDHDLRARFRALTEDIERQIDTCDPTRHWAEIGSDVEEAVATAVGDNFVWAYQRAEALADDVARSFADAGLDSVMSPELTGRLMGGEFGRLSSVAELDSKPAGKAQKVVTGLRGSYGGVVMIGMLSSVAGLGLFNPLSVGAGLILGRMAYKEDKEHRLLRARAEAKTNVRRFVDDVSFVVGKEQRDRLKTIQRRLRDHYRDIATELTRSLNESLQATLTAAHVEETERQNRVRELERQLNILNQVIDNVDKLTPPVTIGRS